MNILISFLTLASGSLALTLPSMAREMLSRDTCDNSATDRGCWGDYSIDTNYYVSFLLEL